MKAIYKQENSFVVAPFVVRPANTPARLDMRSRLLKDKFARRIEATS
jgi:hypothetical protein